MSSIVEFIQKLPKAELHLHLEGSLEPELMFELARRNKIDIPFGSVEDIRAAYNFSNLQDFLDIYYQGMNVLQSEEDYYDLTMGYIKKINQDNCLHTEVFFDPQAHLERGIEFGVIMAGIVAALKDAEKDFGITSRLIMCFLRHLSEDDAFTTLGKAENYLDVITAVGLDSSELGHPPSKFGRVFKAAKERGLLCVAHAGEEGPPEYIYQALDLLKVDRIDHGNRAMEDRALIKRLSSESMTLTVCPLSNLKLCVVDSLEEHPIKRMLQAGLRATINSDDPSYFDGYLNDNYVAVAEAVNLDKADLVTLAKNSFSGSFLSEKEISQHLEQIDSYTAFLP
ncbi:MAG: adenosine deaminase [Emcibacter sp.]|nr:adenosine deaminase [Emcibacter sp.]